jgi:hypothetical protein
LELESERKPPVRDKKKKPKHKSGQKLSKKPIKKKKPKIFLPESSTNDPIDLTLPTPVPEEKTSK